MVNKLKTSANISTLLLMILIPMSIFFEIKYGGIRGPLYNRI
jgi:hypothetical protein